MKPGPFRGIVALILLILAGCGIPGGILAARGGDTKTASACFAMGGGALVTLARFYMFPRR